MTPRYFLFNHLVRTSVMNYQPSMLVEFASSLGVFKNSHVPSSRNEINVRLDGQQKDEGQRLAFKFTKMLFKL